MDFKLLLFCVCTIAFFVVVQGCQISDVKSSSYSTTDGLVIAETAYIAVFSVFCKDSKPDALTLFADVGNNKIVPVTKSHDATAFQVSWTQALEKSYANTYDIKIYDEERLGQLKRAQRTESKEEVSPLFKIELTHPGTYKGPWLQTERVAALASIAVWYLAFKHKMEFN